MQTEITPMLENIHTHTARCHHAKGTERDYVEAAIDRGLAVLGFADHGPQIFPDGYVSGIRMLPEELPEGSILLMQPTVECAAALPGIISALDEKGLRAVCTGEVLA